MPNENGEWLLSLRTDRLLKKKKQDPEWILLFDY